MRFGIVAENLLERIGLASGMVPEPMLEGYGSAFARAVTVGVELGIFEVLALEPMSVGAVSERCGTDPRAREKLLNLLVGARYLHRTRECLVGGVRAKRLLPMPACRRPWPYASRHE